MEYSILYNLKKKYIDMIEKLDKEKQNKVYDILLQDNINMTYDNKLVYIDLERIYNHTWCKIKEYVDNQI